MSYCKLDELKAAVADSSVIDDIIAVAGNMLFMTSERLREYP